MSVRFLLAMAIALLAAQTLSAQQTMPTGDPQSASRGGTAVAASSGQNPVAAGSGLNDSAAPRANPGLSTLPPPPSTAAPAEAQPRRPVTRVTSGNGSLPNESGQLYREYDISPYTARITTTKRPEQAIVDWVLRETGYEAWHSEPLAILSATARTLRVYHTAQVQSLVGEIVDRFNSSEAETQSFSIRVITADSPDWRVRVQRLLTPAPIQAQGAQAWVLEKEAAAVVLNELRRRSDYREHNSPQLLVQNGQPAVVSAMRGRNYVRDVKLRADAWPGFEPETATVDEGFSLEFTPLLSVDGKTVDAAIRCDVDQVERLVPVTLTVPTTVAPRQSTRIEVPQMARMRFHERFRWSADRILMVGLGVVPVPVPRDAKPLVPGLPLPISSGPPRADLLLLVESRGKVSPQTPQVTRGISPGADMFRAR
jgi:hypothetical protein